MKMNLEDKLAYIIAVVNEFAAAFKLNPQQAYRYLDRFKGIDLEHGPKSFILCGDTYFNPLIGD